MKIKYESISLVRAMLMVRNLPFCTHTQMSTCTSIYVYTPQVRPATGHQLSEIYIQHICIYVDICLNIILTYLLLQSFAPFCSLSVTAAAVCRCRVVLLCSRLLSLDMILHLHLVECSQHCVGGVGVVGNRAIIVCLNLQQNMCMYIYVWGFVCAHVVVN